jgi:hypothetical protein
VIVDGSGVEGPGSSANTTNEAMATTLLRIGANMGTANRRLAFRRPVATAPIPYSAIWGMKNLRNSVARSWTASRWPRGTRNV